MGKVESRLSECIRAVKEETQGQGGIRTLHVYQDCAGRFSWVESRLATASGLCRESPRVEVSSGLSDCIRAVLGGPLGKGGARTLECIRVSASRYAADLLHKLRWNHGLGSA